MDIKFKDGIELKSESTVFLYSYDMLDLALTDQNKYDKSFLNISAFDPDLKRIFSNKFKNLNNKNNYIITDFMYTVSTVLCKINNKLYVKNKTFIDSDFYKINLDSAEEISFLNANDDCLMQNYIDDYIELLAKYFDNNKIILLRTTIPRFRANYGNAKMIYLIIIMILMIVSRNLKIIS